MPPSFVVAFIEPMGAEKFVSDGTESSGVVFHIGTSFSDPGFGLEPSGGMGGTRVQKKRETNLFWPLRACVLRKSFIGAASPPNVRHAKLYFCHKKHFFLNYSS